MHTISRECNRWSLQTTAGFSNKHTWCKNRQR